MLSNTCKYALRAVLYLAVNNESGQKIGIKQISKDLDIPSPFLGKILQSLAKHKLLSSTKGPNGGFGIGKDPKDLLLMDVVQVIDGMDGFHKCIIGVRDCSELDNQCALHVRYSELREEISKIFEVETIEHLAKNIKEGKQVYFI